MSILDFPRHIMIEPTNICNSRCPLCPTGAGLLQRTKGFMSLDLFKKLVDEIQDHESIITLWHYGEPFIHRKIYAFIQYAAERDIAVISSTNGYAFYEKASVERLAQSGLSKLIVSMDGASDTVNSRYRQGVNFERVIKGLNYFKELTDGVPVNKGMPELAIQMIAFKHNMSDIEAIQLLAKRLGATFEIKTANLNMVPEVEFEAYLPDQEQYRRYEWDDKAKMWDHKGHFANSCSFVETGLTINWDGSVNPCCYDYQSEYVLGNAHEQSISEIWSGASLEELRNSIRKNRAGLPICAVCGVDRPMRRLAKDKNQ